MARKIIVSNPVIYVGLIVCAAIAINSLSFNVINCDGPRGWEFYFGDRYGGLRNWLQE
jgi:hypothetical protein